MGDRLMATRLMTGDRTPCSVPGCGRSCKAELHPEWICADHWRNTSLRTRGLFFRVRRKGNRYGWTPQLIRLHDRLWEKLKQQAIEKAMGI